MSEVKPNGMIEINVPAELVDYVQMLDYEQAGLKVLHTHAIECDLPQEKTDKIRDKFLEKWKEFCVIRDYVYKNYCEKYGRPTNWRLDYEDGVIYIERSE